MKTCPVCDQSVSHLAGTLPNRYLAVMSEAPFTAPEWCPPEAWQRLDEALALVLSHKGTA
jgi:hypothetical protein